MFTEDYACSYTNDATLNKEEMLNLMVHIKDGSENTPSFKYSDIIDETKKEKIREHLKSTRVQFVPAGNFRLRQFCDSMTFKINGGTNLMTSSEENLWAAILWSPMCNIIL